MDSNTIVVGVDGSVASRAALRWALCRAARDHAPVTAVAVDPRAQLAPGTSYAVQPYGMKPPAGHARNAARLHAAVTEAREHLPGAPTVTEVSVAGDPGVELSRIAEPAAMLVLGHASRGRLAELILGSTAAECLRHARCPVLLVPEGT